jgi:hypothetical protein
MITLLPLLVLMFAYGCDGTLGYYPFHRAYHFLTHFEVGAIIHELKNWSYGSALWYLGIVLQLAVYTIVLPGEEIEGAPLRDGSRLKYRINGK